MGLFDEIVGSVLGGGDKSQALARIAGKLVTGSEGTGDGLAKLVQQFQQRGMSDVVGSWVGTGQNRAISADEMDAALGPEQIDQFAQQSGLPRREVSGGLAQVLPQIIDKMTPDGRLPAQNDVAGMFGKLLDGR
jgi:uncharacterized protein YidB (DUF937 family)